MRNLTFPTQCLFALALVALLIIPETLVASDSETLTELGLAEGKNYNLRSAQQATVFLKVEEQKKPDFVSVGNKFRVRLSASGLVEPGPRFTGIAGDNGSMAPLELSYQNVESSSSISVQEGSEARFNYFLGNDPNRWITDLSATNELVQEDIYAGIDATHFGNSSSLTSRFRVVAGADPKAISFKILGSKETGSTPTGGLELYGTGGINMGRLANPYVLHLGISL